MRRTFGPKSPPLRGVVHVPGDKSVSHRAVLFSAMAEGESHLSGMLNSADVRSTIEAVRALGAHVDVGEQSDGSLGGRIRGWGATCPPAREPVIDCGNSGTTARLLMGVLAGWPTRVTLNGDDSLSARPMRRVTEPLEAMGARFEMNEVGTLPITVQGCARLKAFDFVSPVASAQVKSAVLLAGLHANGVTTVTEPARSRDHTEQLLPAFGVEVQLSPDRLSASVAGPSNLTCVPQLAVPRDPSSAAFLVVAALLVEGSRVTLPGVSLNETRTGFLRVLERMGAQVEVVPWPESGAERVGELVVFFSPRMNATVVDAAEVPSLVDEVPILALAASRARGVTRFEGVGELRVKESDRLSAVVEGLRALGVGAEADGDALVVEGRDRLSGATLESRGDHRLAMTWAVAGLAADGPTEVEGFEAVAVSYPGFANDVASLQAASV